MEQWKNIISDTIYGKQVVGATYRGYFIEIENEYIVKDKKGNIILSTGLKYEVIKFIDKLVEKNGR